MKFFLAFCFIFFCHCTEESSSINEMTSSVFPLTRAKIQNLLKNPPTNQEKLKEESIHGCIFVPAKKFFQRLFIGVENTKKPCSASIHQGNKISISFLKQKKIPLVSTSRPNVLTDIFTTELDTGQVLIVQHVKGKVVSLTQTIYDSKGTVVFQNLSKEEFIRECHFYRDRQDDEEKQTTKPC